MDAVPLERFAPEFSIPDYSPVDALSFCLASQLAYSKLPDGTIDEATIRHQLIEGWGFASVEVFEIVRGRDIDTQGYVAFNDTHVVAAFRGTDSLPDWLTNLQAVKDPGPWENTAVHEGFQDAFLGAVRGRRRRMSIDTTLALSRAELREAANTDEDTIVRVGIEEQLKAYRRLGWASRALARLERATGKSAVNIIFAWRNNSRRQIGRHLGVDHRSASRTAKHILYLVPAITRRATNLAFFIARWQVLDRMGNPATDAVQRLDDNQFREVRKLHDAVIADLRAWAHARGALVGRAREDVSPVAAAFLASLRRLSSKTNEPLIPVISWSEKGETRRVAVV